ncbi:unnamed protein product, partial [Rotaria sordida]
VTTHPTSNSRLLLIPDESTLSRLVAARLDLPISQRLVDQLRIGHDDFVPECDLYTACLILQKQIEHIDGKKDNIVIPSIKMKQVREQNEKHMRQQTSIILNADQSVRNPADVEMTRSSQSLRNESASSKLFIDSTSKSTTNGNERETITTKQISTINDRNQSINVTPSNPCVLCLTEEKQLVCIPCGHMATCVACSHSLRSCPICHRQMETW